ncbi:MAG TPA: hypothetical protein VG604_00410 [Candidatus Saccharimonadales bacterium]|nr:hypothetical protein [Candidatus Saccharimonadales bacterium]
MASDQLTTQAGSGTQTPASGNLQSTGQLQNAGRDSDIGSSSNSVQAGNVGSDINVVPSQSITLTNNLGQSSSASISTAPTVPLSAKHHFNPVFLGFPAVLILIAVAMFWFTKQSSKNTTEYS